MRFPTEIQQRKALKIIAAWLGPQMRDDGQPCPTGKSAAWSAQGPMLVSDWDWPETPTPTLLLEGGPYDWAIYAASDETVKQQLSEIGVFAEPYAGYALCLYGKEPTQ